jgi:nitroreductase
MNDLTAWLFANPIATILFAAAITVILTTFIALFQGRAISFWPPSIGGKPIRIQPGERAALGVIESIKTRKSVRAYLDKPVEDEKINLVMEAARLAPSASNKQEWRFVIVREPETRKKLAEKAGRQAFVAEAPVVIAACAETDGHVMPCGQLSYPIDVAIALDHISLAAVELGLGTCWIGLFDEKLVKEALGIPEEIRVVELMTFGYPADPGAVTKKRLPFNRIVKYEHW